MAHFVVKIPLSELQFRFVRSSGPGGQNVNKVNSKAVLRWNLSESLSISEPLKIKLLERLSKRLTKLNEILVTCDEHRDQTKNRDACIKKLHALLTAAAKDPKVRRASKPTLGSLRRTEVAKKKKTSELKNRRKKQGFDKD